MKESLNCLKSLGFVVTDGPISAIDNGLRFCG